MRTYLVATVAAFALLHGPSASAEPVYYTFALTNVDINAQGNLYLGGSITLTITGDTADVVGDFTRNGPVYYVRGAMTYAVAGGPSGVANFDSRIYYEAFSGILYLYVDLPRENDQFSWQSTTMPPYIRNPLAEDFTSISTTPRLMGNGFSVGTSYVAVFHTSSSRVVFRTSVMPEPSSWIMAGLAAVLLAGYRRSHDDQLLRPRLRRSP